MSRHTTLISLLACLLFWPCLAAAQESDLTYEGTVGELRLTASYLSFLLYEEFFLVGDDPAEIISGDQTLEQLREVIHEEDRSMEMEQIRRILRTPGSFAIHFPERGERGVTFVPIPNRAPFEVEIEASGFYFDRSQVEEDIPWDTCTKGYREKQGKNCKCTVFRDPNCSVVCTECFTDVHAVFPDSVFDACETSPVCEIEFFEDPRPLNEVRPGMPF